jgi:hypothetical protein
MNKSSRALRVAQPLAVVAVWAGLLGYVIPAAFSTPPAVTAAAASALSQSRSGPPHGPSTGHRLPGSTGRASGSPRRAGSGTRHAHPGTKHAQAGTKHAQAGTKHAQAGTKHARAGTRHSQADGRHTRRAGQAQRASAPALKRPASRAGSAQIRVMQASQRAHSVTVTLGRQALASEQPFASVTPYRSVRPGTWTVCALSGGQRATARLTLTAGSTTTLVVLDNRGRLTLSAPGRLAELENVASVTPGSASAPNAGGSPVLWLLLSAVALLLGAAATARLRHVRWARRVAAHIR